MSLKGFIKDQNLKLAFFANKGKQYNTDLKKLTADELIRLVTALSAALSPATLTRDGEIQGAELRIKKKKLMKALDEVSILWLSVDKGA
jgi:hypothetical protein